MARVCREQVLGANVSLDTNPKTDRAEIQLFAEGQDVLEAETALHLLGTKLACPTWDTEALPLLRKVIYGQLLAARESMGQRAEFWAPGVSAAVELRCPLQLLLGSSPTAHFALCRLRWRLTELPDKGDVFPAGGTWVWRRMRRQQEVFAFLASIVQQAPEGFSRQWLRCRLNEMLSLLDRFPVARDACNEMLALLPSMPATSDAGLATVWAKVCDLLDRELTVDPLDALASLHALRLAILASATTTHPVTTSPLTTTARTSSTHLVRIWATAPTDKFLQQQLRYADLLLQRFRQVVVQERPKAFTIPHQPSHVYCDTGAYTTTTNSQLKATALVLQHHDRRVRSFGAPDTGLSHTSTPPPLPPLCLVEHEGAGETSVLTFSSRFRRSPSRIFLQPGEDFSGLQDDDGTLEVESSPSLEESGHATAKWGDDELLALVSSKGWGGGGGHTLFLRTWARGLAYSSGVSVDEMNGRVSFSPAAGPRAATLSVPQHWPLTLLTVYPRCWSSASAGLSSHLSHRV